MFNSTFTSLCFPTVSLRFSGKMDAVARGRKRNNDSVLKVNFEVNPDKLINIQMPPTLKKQLVDDCEVITHLGKDIRFS
ncbi:unnamed protein product [Lupinus luteus]|uniref:Uncharacterized protein n=1 Tax=Lupinus luteus TaxID=3873 RepID=A0AAV1WAA7_LUPLU